MAENLAARLAGRRWPLAVVLAVVLALWHFMAKEAGQAVSWDTWRSEPYRQDAQSTFG